jgi:L-alanine-DL-glutamate epimerase-like enolase superfamily enzyme
MDHYLSLGFRGFKIGVGSYSLSQGGYLAVSPNGAADFEAQKLEFVRAHVGNDVKVMLDGHMGNNPVRTWDLATAMAVVKAVEPYNLFFFEEPLHYTDPWGYAELCKSTAIPIAGGECLTTSYEWRVFVERDCFDIRQPDALIYRGSGEFMKVAALLESRGRKLATHSWGAGGSLLQNIHTAFSANTTIVEWP